MVGLDCPPDAELLGWLQDPLDVERHPLLTAHLNTCASCQHRLEQLDKTDECRVEAAAGDGLLEDLRRQPRVDVLESEPECGRAGILAETAVCFPSGQTDTSRQPDPSDVVALTQRGHYEILGVLGQGGMGVVYKARNLKMNRLVAIKVLPPLKPQDPGAVARFEREMKAVARLTHSHIVVAHDADEADGKHFLVMEYIDGSDLKSLVKAQGPLPVAKAVDYTVQAALGLHYAHEQGIIHRDVKPANLMLDQSGTVKLLDLGLAWSESRSEPQADLTGTGMMMGTVDYLAPEQAASTRDIDGRADIYSLGCSLYYLLTGRPLYDGDTVLQKVLAHREKPIPPLRAACPQCPIFLEQVFAKMVAKRPEQRYQTMAEAIADLEKLRAPPEGCALVEADARPKAAASSKNQTGWRWLHGKRRALAVAVVVVVGICAALLPPLSHRLHTGEGADVPLGKQDSVPDSKKTPAGKDLPVQLAAGTQAGQEWDGNDLKMKFCWCPPGSFLMGSPGNEAGRAEFESPQAKVVLTQGFWMGKFEVTQGEWERVMGTNPSRFHGVKTLPVENTNWHEATKFGAILTERELARGAIPPGWEFRLPTEAHWEYACRARTTTAYGFDATAEGLGDYAWYSYNSDLRTHEVGTRKPNHWGLHDMHGNVWEWCRDWFQTKLQGGTDPDVQEVGTGRVIRGGGWEVSAHLCRTAFRSGVVPDEATHRLGFRVAIVQVSTPGGQAPP